MSTEMKIVMFTDQVNSTNQMSKRTHSEIERISAEQDRLTTAAVKVCRGTIIKDVGDGHFIEFPSCIEAVKCGFLIQDNVKFRNATQTNANLKFELHIGIDFGEAVILPNGDLRANTANLAARICAQCPPGEVYFTEKIKAELNDREVTIAFVGLLQLKGITTGVPTYRFVEWHGAREPTPNPFVFREGIPNSEYFFDRENEQHRIRDLLSKQAKCQLVGPPRTGKTSLLLQVKNQGPVWQTNAIIAYLDLYKITHTTLQGWIESAAHQFMFPAMPRNLIEFGEEISQMINSRHQHPVLCLDQFEQLTARREVFNSDFFNNLRAIGSEGMSILTSSEKRLSELTDPGDPSSPFYNVFNLLRVRAFSTESAAHFVSAWRPGIPSFSDEEKAAILKFAKGHPLALQVACYYVFEAKLNGSALAAAIREARDEMKGLVRNGW
jgi:class 3 adenylate cyclase